MTAVEARRGVVTGGHIRKPVAEIGDLHKNYGRRRAVDGLSLQITPGECYGLLGPNGAGKTTAILAICGLIDRDGGFVRIEGADPLGSRRRNVAARRKIGYVPQEIALYDDLTGAENLRYFGRLYGLRGSDLQSRVREMLDFVDLNDRADDRTVKYSGGMKRRLNIAVALLHRPALVVLDEPTVGIDPQSRNSILENLDELRSEGTALLYTSHYMEEVERICDRIGIMDGGRLIAEGTRESLLESMGTDSGRIMLNTGRRPTDELLATLAASPGVQSVTATADGPLLTVLAVADHLPGVLACAADAGLRINRISVEQADLEALFLQLTGKALRDG